MTNDHDIANALQRIAKQKNITRLVIGRPADRPLFKKLFERSLIDRLEKENKQMDILILRQDKLVSVYQRYFPSFHFISPLLSYAAAFLVVLVITIIGYLLTPLIGHKPVGFIYLIGIMLLGFFVGQGPVFLAAILSAFSWTLLFTRTLFSPGISPEDISLVLTYFFSAIIVGLLTIRGREKDLYLFQREEKIEHLYGILSEISKSPNIQSLRLNVGAKLKDLFGGEFDILSKGGDNKVS